jgi:hypothetical protein
MESRQVHRARRRQRIKAARPNYPHKAQKGGPSKMLIHKNRRHRDDGFDYFKTAR